LIDVRWQWRLDKNAVNRRVGVEPGDEFEQIVLGSRLGQDACDRSDSEPGADPFLHAHVNLRGRVFADAHKSQARLHALLFQEGNAPGVLGVNFFGDGPSVNEIGGRHQGTTWIDSTSMMGVLTQRWSMSSSPVTMTFLPANFLRLT